MSTGCGLTLNADTWTLNDTSALAASDSIMSASWKSSRWSMQLRHEILAFVMGGSQFEWWFERQVFFVILSCHAKGIFTDDVPRSNTCIPMARGWVRYRWFSFLLLSLLDACQGRHYRRLSLCKFIKLDHFSCNLLLYSQPTPVDTASLNLLRWKAHYTVYVILK
jgi:hypothetical protein